MSQYLMRGKGGEGNPGYGGKGTLDIPPVILVVDIHVEHSSDVDTKPLSAYLDGDPLTQLQLIVFAF